MDIVFPYNEDVLIELFAKEINYEFGESIVCKNIWTATKTPYFVIFAANFKQKKFKLGIGICDPSIRIFESVQISVPLWCYKRTLKHIAHYLKHNVVYLINEAEISAFG